MSLALIMRTELPDGDDGGASSEDIIVHALRHPPTVLDTDKAEVVDAVSKLLLSTPSDKVRNAAAILLTELIGREAKESIVQVLRRSGAAKAAGSLLYALNEVEATLPLDLVIELVEHGSLEAQGEALTFLEDSRIDPADAAQLENARARLTLLLIRSDAPKIVRAAALAVDYLDDVIPTAE